MTIARLQVRRHLPRFTLDVELEFSDEILVLFGPSGAGKSLTLQAIAGLLRPDEGYVTVAGRTLFDSERGIDLPPRQRRVGYVMQDYALFPHLTVVENILFGLHGLDRASQLLRLGEMTELLRLDGLERRRPRELSGGQQQRVALARALITRPLLLLLDEPFAALDSPMRARLRRELRLLQQRVKLPMLLVTHDLAEAHVLADRMAVIDGGRVLQIGAPGEVLQRPGSTAVARFTGARNIFIARITERGADGYSLWSRRGPLLADHSGADRFAIGDEVVCVVRPEAITLVRPAEGMSRSGRREVLYEGTITEELDHGLWHTLLIRLASGGGGSGVDLEIDLSDRAYQRLGVQPGQRWTLAIDSASVHIIGLAEPPFFEGPAPQPPWDESDAGATSV